MPERIGFREVFGLAWPLIVSMLSYTVMSVVDSVYVGQLGTAHLGAVGLAAVTVFTFHGFGNGVLSGLKVSVAQSTGAGEGEVVRRLGWQGLYLALGMGLVEAALAPAASLLFEAQNASAAVTPLAAEYFEIRVLGGPFAFGLVAASAWFQGRGQTRLPMVAAILSNGVNVALDPLFIFGWGPVPAYGVAGAAIATVISYVVGTLFLMIWLLPALRGSDRRPSRPLLARVWRVGAPMGVRATLEIGSFMVFSAVLAAVGDAHLAAHVIVVRIISVSFLPGYGIGEATAILVGQALGAGRRDLVPQVRRAATILAVSVMAGCGVLFVLMPGPLTAIFDPTPTVEALAGSLLLVAAAFQVFDAVLMVAQGVLNGAGDTRFVMIAGVATAWAVKLPLGWALAVPLGLGAAGAWYGLTVEIVVIAVICVARLRGGRWLDRAPEPTQVTEAEAEPEPALAAVAS